MTTQLELRDIAGHPGYRIGNDGSVWSCWKNRWGMTNEWQQLTATKMWTRNYCRLSVQFGRNGPRKYVHHLVLEAFVGPRPEGTEACHRDGDATNNALDNLYWGTRDENTADRLRHERHYNLGLTCAQVEAVREAQAAGVSQRLLAQLTGVSQPTISALLNGHRYTHVA